MHGLKNLAYNALAAYQEYLVGLIVALLIARSLGPEVFGLYGMIMWIVAAGVLVASGGAGIAVMRYLSAYRGAGRTAEIASLIAAGRNAVVALIPVALLVSLAFLVFFSEHEHIELHRAWFGVVVVAVAARSLSIYLLNTARGFEEVDRVYRVNVVVNPLNLALVVLAWWWYANLDGYLYVYGVVSVLYMTAAYYFVMVRRAHPYRLVAPQPLKAADRSRLLHSIASLSLLSIVSFIVERQVEVLFLNHFGLQREAGIYNAAFMLASAAVTLIPGILTGIYLPIVAKSSTRSMGDQVEKFRELSRYTFLLTAPLLAFAIAFSGKVVVFVFGEAYADAAWPFALIVVGLGLAKACDAANSVLIGNEKQALMTKLILGFAILNLILDYVLIRYFGLSGAVGALLVKQLGMAVALIGAASRTLGAILEYGHYLKVLLIAAGAVVPALGLSWVIQSSLITPVLAVVYGLTFLALMLAFKQLRQHEIALLRSLATLRFRHGAAV